MISPWRVTLTFFRAHLSQVTFDLTEVLDLGLQGFNLRREAHTKADRVSDLWELAFMDVTRGKMW